MLQGVVVVMWNEAEKGSPIMRMCLNRNVLIGLGAITVGVFLLNRSLLGVVLPFACFAACPLFMVLMGRAARSGRYREPAASELVDAPYPFEAGSPTPAKARRVVDEPVMV